MRKKTLIQILLFFLLILLSFIIFIKYFNKSNLIDENNDKDLLQSSEDKDINNKKDILKNVKYTSNNVQGDIFELKADFGESSLDQPNLMFLTNVKGEIIFKDNNKPNINLKSKFANFNTVSFETTFIDNVKITRSDEVITGDELYLILDYEDESLDNTMSEQKEENLIRMSNNIFFKKPGYTLKADILEIDLITKNTKIYMNNSLEKVKITSLIN